MALLADDQEVLDRLLAAVVRGPDEAQIAAAPGQLLAFCRTPRLVELLYPWGERRHLRPRMVRALVREAIAAGQLVTDRPDLPDWAWVWSPAHASGPGTPPAPEALDALTPARPAIEDEFEAPDDEGEPAEEPAPDEEEGSTYHQRAGTVRAKTIDVRRMTKVERERNRLLTPNIDHPRPRTRAECVNGPRPCVYVGCRHHLYLDVDENTGSIKLNFPDREPGDLRESCALDVADQGGVTLLRVGDLLNLTRERTRQIEQDALSWLPHERLRSYFDENAPPRRRLPLLPPPPPKEIPVQNPTLIPDLLAYCASVTNGANRDSVLRWLAARGLNRVAAESLVEELVTGEQLAETERAAAGGTVVVRYRPAVSVTPAPLPTSDAPTEAAPAPEPAPQARPSTFAGGQQAKIFPYLAGHPEGLTVAEIAEALEIAPSTIHQALDRASERGIVIKRPDPRDRTGRRLLWLPKATGEAAATAITPPAPLPPPDQRPPRVTPKLAAVRTSETPLPEADALIRLGELGAQLAAIDTEEAACRTRLGTIAQSREVIRSEVARLLTPAQASAAK